MDLQPAWEDERYDRLWDSVRKDLELIDRCVFVSMTSPEALEVPSCSRPARQGMSHARMI